MPLTRVTGVDANHGPEVAALANAVNTCVDAINAGGTAIADQTVLANISGGAAVPVGQPLSLLIDNMIGTSGRGYVLYRGALGWAALSPGTNGQVLASQGSGADPRWVNPGTPFGLTMATKSGNFVM